MAISIELIDDNHKENELTIITGENIILKFVPHKVIPLSQRPKLVDVLNITDLPISPKLALVKGITKGTREIKDYLGGYVKTWSSGQTGELESYKQKVNVTSDSIKEAERQLGISISDIHPLAFCSNCKAYVGEADSLITQCPNCSTPLSSTSQLLVSYLDNTTHNYLDGGTWLEDYMGLLLTKGGWKVWTHGSVMGTSGILHPIDILAIKEGRVMIAECKTGMVDTRDISHFMVQKIDIQSHFGLFLALQKCSSKSTAPLLKVSTSKLIDDIASKTDKEVMELINIHVAKFA